MKSKFRFNSTHNSVCNGKEFYISYNWADSAIYGCDTTALVVGQMERFYILDGDHRKQYQERIEQGFDACYQYFLDNIEQRNKGNIDPLLSELPIEIFWPTFKK